MRKFYTCVVNHKKSIICVFAILFIICLGARSFISVNYDMNDYLPEDSPSTVALDKMEAEYDGGIPNARVMVRNVTIQEALAYKAKIEAVDGVSDVTWLDDSEDISTPTEFMDEDTLETYYMADKDGDAGTALFSVTIDKDKRIETVDSIRDIIGDENAMSGSAVSTAVATTSTVTEIPIIAIFGVAFALFVLALTTTSWAEPVIVLVGIGVAVIINSGSNLIFGEISFVTNAAGNILQLAVSLDYSVFLLHRFAECKLAEPDEKAAMVDALCGSTTSILSSGLTTVIGFLALCMMRFGIGPDLGLALAKGIAISLITVFIFMPVFILSTYKFVEKTRHRSFMPAFTRFGRFVCKVMIPCVVIFAIAIVPSYLASNRNSFYYGSSHIFGSETQLGSDVAAIEEVFGKSDTYVLMVPKDDRQMQSELSTELHDISQVKDIVSYVDTVSGTIPTAYLDSGTLEKLESDDYTRMVISVKVDFEGDETFALVNKIREVAEKYYPGEWYLAGEGVSTLDLRDTVTSDMAKVNLIAIGAVFIVLLFAMKSISIPVILVLAIETAIWINLAVPYFAGNSIFYIAYLIISSIQLGATVDYAILFTDRYKEFREEMGKSASIIKVFESCTVSVMTSASVLTVVGFLLGAVSTHGVLSQLGLLLGQGTICSLAIVLFVVPGLLYLFDGLIQHTTRGIRFKNEKKDVLDKIDEINKIEEPGVS